MRTKYIIAAAVCGIAAAATTAPAFARINQRQAHQQHRIANGVHSGALTAHEAVRVERQQVRIARYERQSRADGGGLNFNERARIEHMQDRASRNIYHQKHDAQGR
jgi:hypothetical protein